MAKIELPDAVLVKEYVKGNENAFEILLERHQSKIYSFIYNKIKDREITEDIFQDTFIKVIRTIKLNQYNEEGKFLSWVMRIAHNLIVDYFRKNKKMPLSYDTEAFSYFDIIKDSTKNIDEFLFNIQVNKDLENLLLELPQEQKEVLILRFFEEKSFKEISEITNVSINTALGRMRYALLNLRKLIEKHNIILTMQ